jgi:hypothetical protein
MNAASPICLNLVTVYLGETFIEIVKMMLR